MIIMMVNNPHIYYIPGVFIVSWYLNLTPALCSR